MSNTGKTFSKKLSIIMIVFISLLISLLLIFKNTFIKTSIPEIKIVNGKIFHPDSTIIVETKNLPSDDLRNVIIRIDDSKIDPSNLNEENQVKINLVDLNFSEEEKKDGIHLVQFKLPGEVLANIDTIYFDSECPKVIVNFKKEMNNELRIFGSAIDGLQTDHNKITGKLTIFLLDSIQTILLPISMKKNTQGERIFEFEYLIKNIPNISTYDKNKEKPFIELNIQDKACNVCLQQFRFEEIFTEVEFSKKTTKERPKDITTSSSSIKPKKMEKPKAIPRKIIKDQFNSLSVKSNTFKQISLKWNHLPDNFIDKLKFYKVMRQGRVIGKTSDCLFVDKPIKKKTTYRIIACYKNNIDYLSNEIVLSPLRGINLPIININKKPSVSTIPEISENLIKWMEKHPVEFTPLIKYFMNHTKNALTSKVSFRYGNSVIDLFMVFNIYKAYFTFFVIEDKDGTLIEVDGMNDNCNHFYKGTIKSSEEGEIIKFAKKELQPSEENLKKYNTLIFSWWEQK